MAKRRRKQTVDMLIEQVDGQLAKLGRTRRDLTLREKVVSLSEIYEGIKDLGVNVLHEHGWDASSAIERIRLYFVEYVGTVIDGIEIAIVSGISEYGRRIRQLRVEQGYQIASGASADPGTGIALKPDQYVLVAVDPDADAARRWHIVNRIRRRDISAQRRLLEFLTENVGITVTTEELAYVARSARQYARRVRELRTEQGYSIATRFTGRPDLNMGQYVLQSKERVAEPHDRHIPESVQKSVYARDENACRLCGWNHDRWSPADPRILELHHVEHHSERGSNLEENLIVICSKCHDEVHAGQHAALIEKIRTTL